MRRQYRGPNKQGLRETLHVDFVPVRLIGIVCEPPTVGRELSENFVEISVQIRKTVTVTEERQHPDVILRLGITHSINDLTAIARPIGRNLIRVGALQESTEEGLIADSRG